MLAQFDDDDDEASRERARVPPCGSTRWGSTNVTDLIAEMRSGSSSSGCVLRCTAARPRPPPARLPPLPHLPTSTPPPQVMDTVRPGVVEWEKVVLKPKNVYNKITSNCNYAVALAKDPKAFKFSVWSASRGRTSRMATPS